MEAASSTAPVSASKAIAWWKADTSTSRPTMMSPLLNLPGELRNLIYDMVVADMEDIIIREGVMVQHPLAQVNRQIRSEFRPIFNGATTTQEKPFRPTKIEWHLRDFDCKGIIDLLNRCVITPSIKFDIHVKVTKQIHREDWRKLWPWVQFCDHLMPKNLQHQGKTLPSTYSLDLGLNRCNPYTASHELYAETMPYILKGAGGRFGMFSGYEEIQKIRCALRDSVAKG